jgi:5-methylcytosine-specific restriction endonuclease McrA
MEKQMKALALNKGYVPIRLVSPYEAVCKIYTGASVGIVLIDGEMTELKWEAWFERSQTEDWPEDQWFLHSQQGRTAVPRVIRHLRYNMIPKASVKLNRKNIYFRDAYKCYICGKDFDEDELSIDHIIPSSRGGKREWTNLITCCKRHNREKGDKLLGELGWKPKFMAYAPKQSNMARLKSEILDNHEEWRYFGVEKGLI